MARGVDVDQAKLECHAATVRTEDGGCLEVRHVGQWRTADPCCRIGRCDYCHRALQNQPPMGASKPARGG